MKYTIKLLHFFLSERCFADKFKMLFFSCLKKCFFFFLLSFDYEL